MSTSGSIDFTATRDEIIEGAFSLCGAKDPTEALSAEYLTIGTRALNLYIKALMTKAPQLWRQTEGVLFLNEDQQSYSLGTGGDHSAKLDDLFSTTLSAAASSAATSITLTSVSGLAVSDKIGIAQDDGTRHWTTVATIVGSTVTLASGLTDDAASGLTVYGYTTLLERPVRLYNLRRRQGTTEIPVDLVSRSEYFEQPTKAAEGKIVLAYYSPQLSAGKLYVWPTADTAADQLRFTYERTFEDMDSALNNFDMPIEAVEMIKYGLAVRIGPEIGAPMEIMRTLKAESEQRESEAMAFDQEDASVFFTPR